MTWGLGSRCCMCAGLRRISRTKARIKQSWPGHQDRQTKDRKGGKVMGHFLDSVWDVARRIRGVVARVRNDEGPPLQVWNFCAVTVIRSKLS